MGYLVAAYAITGTALAVYALWLRRRLRELRTPPDGDSS